MIIGRVYGSVVSTHKLENLVGYKFMLVQCIENGERIAQLVIAPYITANFIISDELDDTLRGTGGFGSTGEK